MSVSVAWLAFWRHIVSVERHLEIISLLAFSGAVSGGGIVARA